MVVSGYKFEMTAKLFMVEDRLLGYLWISYKNGRFQFRFFDGQFLMLRYLWIPFSSKELTLLCRWTVTSLAGKADMFVTKTWNWNCFNACTACSDLVYVTRFLISWMTKIHMIGPDISRVALNFPVQGMSGALIIWLERVLSVTQNIPTKRTLRSGVCNFAVKRYFQWRSEVIISLSMQIQNKFIFMNDKNPCRPS